MKIKFYPKINEVLFYESLYYPEFIVNQLNKDVWGIKNDIFSFGKIIIVVNSDWTIDRTDITVDLTTETIDKY